MAAASSSSVATNMPSGTGILVWAQGVIDRMSQDPGRTYLMDHIQLQGFTFLKNYLDDIKAGPKTEPIIELAKTPGRRKQKTATGLLASAGKVKPINFREQEMDKENSRRHPIQPLVLISPPKNPSHAGGVLSPKSINVTQPWADTRTHKGDVSSIAANQESLLAPPADINIEQDLSMIPEGDEDDGDISKRRSNARVPSVSHPSLSANTSTLNAAKALSPSNVSQTTLVPPTSHVSAAESSRRDSLSRTQLDSSIRNPAPPSDTHASSLQAQRSIAAPAPPNTRNPPRDELPPLTTRTPGPLLNPVQTQNKRLPSLRPSPTTSGPLPAHSTAAEAGTQGKPTRASWLTKALGVEGKKSFGGGILGSEGSGAFAKKSLGVGLHTGGLDALEEDVFRKSIGKGRLKRKSDTLEDADDVDNGERVPADDSHQKKKSKTAEEVRRNDAEKDVTQILERNTRSFDAPPAESQQRQPSTEAAGGASSISVDDGRDSAEGDLKGNQVDILRSMVNTAIGKSVGRLGMSMGQTVTVTDMVGVWEERGGVQSGADGSDMADSESEGSASRNSPAQPEKKSTIGGLAPTTATPAGRLPSNASISTTPADTPPPRLSQQRSLGTAANVPPRSSNASQPLFAGQPAQKTSSEKLAQPPQIRSSIFTPAPGSVSSTLAPPNDVRQSKQSRELRPASTIFTQLNDQPLGDTEELDVADLAFSRSRPYSSRSSFQTQPSNSQTATQSTAVSSAYGESFFGSQQSQAFSQATTFQSQPSQSHDWGSTKEAGPSSTSEREGASNPMLRGMEKDMNWSQGPSHSRGSDDGSESGNEGGEDSDMDDFEQLAEELRRPTSTLPNEPTATFTVGMLEMEPSQPSGLLAQATSFVSKAFGGGKKGKAEPPKSLQLAAQAAKKQQAEQERRAQRTKEMEAKRLHASQRKEEEKTRALEAEKRKREEGEKRKREEAPPLSKSVVKGKKPTPSSDDEPARKRKMTAEIEKKTVDLKKAAPKEKATAPPSRIAKPVPPSLSQSQSQPQSQSQSQQSQGSSSSQSQTIVSKSTLGILFKTSQSNLAATASAATVKLVNAAAGPSNLPPLHRVSSKASIHSISLAGKQPSQALQAQMQARVQEQVAIEREKTREMERLEQQAASENIVLPDIASEYSDSDDENRKTYDAPDWATSPHLSQQLEDQRLLNPDVIFGAVPEIQMEKIFKSRNPKKYRDRTSSANWSGPDQLSAYEKLEYSKKMGYIATATET